jgi:nicotinamide-nucleotide amidase
LHLTGRQAGELAKAADVGRLLVTHVPAWVDAEEQLAAARSVFGAAELARHGAVHAQVAAQMATGVRERLGATWGLATTGVAGPEPQDGRPAGTVHLGLAGPDGVRTVSLHLDGDRVQVRAATVDAALALLLG